MPDCRAGGKVASKKDYYETLGISKGASDDEIKRAYRKLAKQYHPDNNPGNAESEDKFKEVGEAYQVLSDKEKRAAYDQFGHSAFEQGGASGGYGFGGFDFGGFDASEIFEQFFGGGSSRRNGPRRGADTHVNVTITFEEAFTGTKKEIQVGLMENCEECGGSGAKSGTVAENCKHCNGTGQERILQQTVFGTVTQVRTCRSCNGEGKIIREKCSTCSGKGKVRKNKTLTVNIPKGIDNGQSIALQGKGDPGQKGGPYGDMIVTVNVMPHKLFTRRDNNLYIEVPITFVQATLGSEISIPTMTGEEKYSIKSGTQTGTVFSMKGKGMPYVRNERIVGDLIVTLKVSVPTSLSDKQRAALLNFAEEMGDEYKIGRAHV